MISVPNPVSNHARQDQPFAVAVRRQSTEGYSDERITGEQRDGESRRNRQLGKTLFGFRTGAGDLGEGSSINLAPRATQIVQIETSTNWSQ